MGLYNESPSMRRLSGVLILFVVVMGAAAASSGGDATLLPEARVDLSLSRYAPSDRDFIWTGWLGGEMGLVEQRGRQIALSGHIETILGNGERAYEARQGNYHITLSGQGRRGRTDVGVFVHHVSRHLLDRPMTGVAAWNIVGARGRRILGDPVLGRFTLSAGLGRVVQQTLVGYGWEATARLEAEVIRAPWGEGYVEADLRGVTARSSEALPRGGFLDARVEAGARWRRSRHLVETFAALDHRNDVYLDAPGARTRLLFGLRLGYAGGDAADTGRAALRCGR